MIRFSCRCGNILEVDSDQAGGELQCAVCGLLNDVPLHGELGSLAIDGTFKIDDPRKEVEAERLEELAVVFGQKRLEFEPQELDLRAQEEDLANIGRPYDVAPTDTDRPPMMKYDPVTGELIRAIDIKPVPVLPAVSGLDADNRTLNYARRRAPTDSMRAAQMPRFLLRPVNLFVMSVILIAHVLFNFAIFTVVSGIVFVFIGPLILFCLILAHYGGVIDEIGPEQRDELPRPLRNIGWLDDLWGPFVAVAGAIMICFGMMFFGSRWIGVHMAMVSGAVGLALFPAVLLTTTTGGSVWNLRPDRVFAVIARCGAAYPFLILESLGALIVYPIAAYATLGSLVNSMSRPGSGSGLGYLSIWWVSYPLLMIGIWLTHLFCWHLGLMYRKHEPQFPWIMRRFIGTSSADRVAANLAKLAPRKHQHEMQMENVKIARNLRM